MGTLRGASIARVISVRWIRTSFTCASSNCITGCRVMSSSENSNSCTRPGRVTTNPTVGISRRTSSVDLPMRRLSPAARVRTNMTGFYAYARLEACELRVTLRDVSVMSTCVRAWRHRHGCSARPRAGGNAGGLTGKDIEGRRFASVSTEAAERVARARAMLSSMGRPDAPSPTPPGPPPFVPPANQVAPNLPAANQQASNPTLPNPTQEVPTPPGTTGIAAH
jgi:hypothetical protein